MGDILKSLWGIIGGFLGAWFLADISAAVNYGWYFGFWHGTCLFENLIFWLFGAREYIIAPEHSAMYIWLFWPAVLLQAGLFVFNPIALLFVALFSTKDNKTDKDTRDSDQAPPDTDAAPAPKPLPKPLPLPEKMRR